MPKEANKKQNKDKKHFMKDFKAELKRVIWPTPKQLLNNTVAVITVVLITAAIVFVLDFAFESINKYGIEKLKETVGTTNSVNQTEGVDTNSMADLENATETDTTSDENANQTDNAEANNVE